MRYALIKYRNKDFSDNEQSVVLFHFYNLLIRDSNKNDIDPYIYKIIVQGKAK